MEQLKFYDIMAYLLDVKTFKNLGNAFFRKSSKERFYYHKLCDELNKKYLHDNFNYFTDYGDLVKYTFKECFDCKNNTVPEGIIMKMINRYEEMIAKEKREKAEERKKIEEEKPLTRSDRQQQLNPKKEEMIIEKKIEEKREIEENNDQQVIVFYSQNDSEVNKRYKGELIKVVNGDFSMPMKVKNNIKEKRKLELIISAKTDTIDSIKKGEEDKKYIVDMDFVGMAKKLLEDTKDLDSIHIKITNKECVRCDIHGKDLVYEIIYAIYSKKFKNLKDGNKPIIFLSTAEKQIKFDKWGSMPFFKKEFLQKKKDYLK